MNTIKPTEHELAETVYVFEYCSQFLKKEESLARYLNFIEFKVKNNGKGARNLLERTINNHSVEEIKQARDIIDEGMLILGLKLRERVLNEAPDLIIRCAKCGGVLRTPNARQCRWCGDNWHDLSE